MPTAKNVDRYRRPAGHNRCCSSVWLWRALYASTTGSAGLGEQQAVGYAVLAVPATRLRETNRNLARDTVIQHMYFGTIGCWFLRPISPRRFPGWFQAISEVLPFQDTLGVPLWLYVGRLPLSALPGLAAVQPAWGPLLAVLTRLLWRRAADRVVSQGG